jgi:hypothetical protein
VILFFPTYSKSFWVIPTKFPVKNNFSLTKSDDFISSHYDQNLSQRKNKIFTQSGDLIPSHSYLTRFQVKWKAFFIKSVDLILSGFPT